MKRSKDQQRPAMVRMVVSLVPESDEAFEVLNTFTMEFSILLRQFLPILHESFLLVADLYFTLPLEISVNPDEVYTKCRALIEEGNV